MTAPDLTTALAAVIDEAPGWQGKALCAQTDPEAFFPEKGGSTRPAKRVCMACDVRSACLDYALEHGIRFGIWGGTTERQRRLMRRTDNPAHQKAAA